jgi:outer membrane protein assembly factor BamB
VVGSVFVGGTAFLIGRPVWNARCSAGFGEISAKELGKIHSVPLDQVNVDDFSEVYRPNARALLEVSRHPAAPLGPARSAVVVPHEYGSSSVRLANSNDGNIRFEVGAAGLIGSHSTGGVAELDAETGRASWGRRQVGYAAGGGDLSARFLLSNIPRDQAPRLAAVDTDDGDLAWCRKLGKDVETDFLPTFDSAVKGDALFTVRAADTDDKSDQYVRLSRVDTESGDLSWDKTVKGLPQADSLALLGDQLLLSPLRTDLDNQDLGARLLPDRDSQPVRDRGALVARSTADGAASWTYRGPDDRAWSNNVVGVGKDTAVVISRRAAKNAGKQWVTETWMVGLDRAGKQLWKHDLKGQFDYDLSNSFVVTDDQVVSAENGAAKNSRVLVARDLATGAERWQTRLEGDSSPFRMTRTEVVGDSLLAAGYEGGLLAADLKTGKISNPLPGQKLGPIGGIVSDGRTVTIDMNGLFITFDRTF